VPPRGPDAEAARMNGGRMLRSLLFVPGDNERKLARALGCGADALIIDLEDSVEPGRLGAARAQVLEFLQAESAAAPAELWVRVNALSSGRLYEDVTAVLPGRPAGLVLPKIDRYADLEHIALTLEAIEAGHGLQIGSTRLIVIGTETPTGLLSLSQYPQAAAEHSASARRVVGLTWGMEDLSATLGARVQRGPDGALRPVFEQARTTCLLVAAAMGVAALDTVFVEYRDADGLCRETEQARADGFTGKLAIHPDQIPLIHAAFAPSTAELEWARGVLAAFAAAPEAGVTSFEGRMLDQPHRRLAQRILRQAGVEPGE
jgi:citrate lyase subunit beta/citryl-CoA lyase